MFVGHTIDPAIPGVEHVAVRRRGGRATAPLWFRHTARRAISSTFQDNDVVVSFGANCPPGDVCVVNSVHRSWLRFGRPVTVHGVRVPNALRYLLVRHVVLLGLERSYFRTARRRRVAAVSEAVALDLRELYDVPLDRTEVIPNGFSGSQCSPSRRLADRRQQRAAWGVAEGTIVLLFVANELHRKGFDCLLEAVARTGDPAFEIHVVGRAPIDPYDARISQLGLEQRVHHHGSLDIGLAHAAADALVLPTQYEAFALTIVEALASGLPVVTTTVPGAGDLITAGVNGLLQRDPGDADELAALLHQLSDPALRERLGAAGPESVAHLEWDRLMSRLDELVQARP